MIDGAPGSRTVSETDVIVIGAGIAGLCAAGELVRAGRRVIVLEKSRGVGGRMATRRVGAAVCDHGAQFFTVRGRGFEGLVQDAAAAGAVAVWCHGFTRNAGPAAGDGHARYRGATGMTDLPKRLAALATTAGSSGRCAIRAASRAVAVGPCRAEGGGRSVEVVLEAAAGSPVERLSARGALLTAPVPQSLDLLAAAGLALDPAAGDQLATVGYDPCFALLAVLDRPSLVPPPGGVQFDADEGGAVAWIADNHLKGISAVPALTIHATGRFSREHFDAPREDVERILLEHARPWIDGDPARVVVATSLQRWKFALPTALVPEPLVAVSAAPPIACCGDAFGGPRVEGAASSGMAAARWMDRALATTAGLDGATVSDAAGARTP